MVRFLKAIGHLLLDPTRSGAFIGWWADAMSKGRLDDPVYKKNVQRLIERSRRFEEAKE